jgi:PAS domain S-box-containing protein/diguanylate cyclase (GGDEF)-like protein
MHAIDFRQVVEEADIGICITQDDRFQYVNPKFAQMHGWTAEELIGSPLSRVVHPTALGRVNEVQRLRSLGRHHAPYPSQNVHRDGHVFDTRVFGRVIDYRGREANLTTVSDISELTDAQDRIERLVNYHPVTGLATRTLLLTRAAAAIELAQRENRAVAMLFLRVAEVDRVHDALGLLAGDALATTLAARVLTCCRTEDTAAHLGSGEFVILLEPGTGIDESQALNTASRLLATLATPAAIDRAELVIEGQIGIAMFPSDSTNAGELLAHAHAACGRFGPGISFFTPEAGASAARRIRLETALRRAFERDEFELHYQPQVDLRSGSVIGVEALLRWRCDEFGAVSPAEFVPIAEEIGLIVPLGEWVFRSACLQSVAWQRAGLPSLRIGVNLSPRQLEEADISQRLQAILRDTGADPNRLGVEVTESMLMRDFDHARRTLQELSAIGVEIALDDFGTGYSNLGALRALPFDVLKIDRSLVHDVTAAPGDVSITRAVLMLARGLELKVLAEGVETEGQLNLLISNGCELMQGYIFSKPLPAAALGQMLRDGERLPERLLHRKGRSRALRLVDAEASRSRASRRA